MSLRLYHYREQMERADASAEHRQKVADRIALCEQQHADLSNSLPQLLADIFAGEKQGQSGDVIRRTNLLVRVTVSDHAQEFIDVHIGALGAISEHGCIDAARANRIDAHAFRRVVECHRSRQLN